jgi:hypothetical protein
MRCYEDLAVERREESGPHPTSAHEIIEFGKKYDPQ